ncbi:sugar phosphate isomerase/epimerase family protein [Rhizobium tropici]|uniref:TIM barrel protein n=1 Tax=Rhizobium tropici TaxID=398 RepID=A0A6P1CE17_RHITR|nr:putative sugar isomerase [Rhizobium tropici CIAT 899]NEV15087.1 TIM barrel protein [Rhizobium tropici]TGE98842.1 sugar phosphate isomerase [Rhizobium sp. SEMIA 4088]
MVDLSDRFAVSTWSLHRALGATYPYKPGDRAYPARQSTYGKGTIELIDVPQQCADHSIFRLEICSFHLPSLLPSYLRDFRKATEEAGVKLQTLLVEDGDLSNSQTAHRDAEWMEGWIDVAAALGAENMRVIAGKARPTDPALMLAETHLRRLAELTAAAGVRLVIENWFDLLPGPTEVNRILDALHGKVGLNGDFGNWERAGKYEDLAKIMGRAELCHAKGRYSAAGLDEEDYVRCIELSNLAGYQGPFTLIYDSAYHQDEWSGILEERDCIARVFGEKFANDDHYRCISRGATHGNCARILDVKLDTRAIHQCKS